MHRSPRLTTIALAAACLGPAAASCIAATAAAAGTDRASGTAALKSYLPTRGELTGFSPSGSVQLVSSIAASVANDPKAIRSSDSAQLRQDGFGGEVEQLYDYRAGGGIGTSQGLASVTAFHTSTGASAYKRFTFGLQSKPSAASGTARQTRFDRLSVPGVPGGEAAAEIGLTYKRTATNVEWIEGRCLIQLGDSVPGHAPVSAPLISAAQQISRHTRRACGA